MHRRRPYLSFNTLGALQGMQSVFIAMLLSFFSIFFGWGSSEGGLMVSFVMNIATVTKDKKQFSNVFIHLVETAYQLLPGP